MKLFILLFIYILMLYGCWVETKEKISIDLIEIKDENVDNENDSKDKIILDKEAKEKNNKIDDLTWITLIKEEKNWNVNNYNNKEKWNLVFSEISSLEKESIINIFSNSSFWFPIVKEILHDDLCLINNWNTELLELIFDNWLYVYWVNKNTCNKHERWLWIYDTSIWSLPSYSKNNPLLVWQRIGKFNISYWNIWYWPVITFWIYFWSAELIEWKYKQYFWKYVLLASAGANSLSEVEINKYSKLIKEWKTSLLPNNIKDDYSWIINFLTSL